MFAFDALLRPSLPVRKNRMLHLAAMALSLCLPAVLTQGVFAPTAFAQDTRTVTEPAFPATCSALAATQAVITSGTPPQSEVNFSGEPTSETTFDTTRIQNALTACPSGQAVELTTDATGANNAFLIGPLNIPKGVTLMVDAGVTVFGSRNPADYQVSGGETCGTVGTAGTGCKPLLTVNNNSSSTGSGIMGFGVINGRGGDKLIVNGTVTANSWWDIANQANTGSNAQNNPILLYTKNAASFTLYKITLINSPMFHVKYQTASGFTVWGVKIVTPYSARNTDGIDPDDKIQNITIANSFISDGDDNIAIGSSGSGNLVSNVSILNNATHAGHGVSIGSYTSGGVSNVLVQNLTQQGDSADSNSAGIKIKSSQDRGGLVTGITYQNICMQTQRAPMQFNPLYNTSSGTSYPSYQNIVVRNLTDLTSGNVDLDGLNANYPLGLTLDNVNFTAGATLSPAPQYANITLGPGPVTPASLTTSTGTGVTYSGSVTNPSEAPYACTAGSFPALDGELFLSTVPYTSNATAGQTNQQTLSVAANGSFTLNAVVENTDALFTAPSAAINFMEGTNVVGTATLAGNGTLAQYTLSGATSGTHTYTAQYAGDGAHAAFSFGSVTVNVATSPAAVATTTTLNAPASANYGAQVTFTATVTAASGTATPTGTVNFMNGSTTLGSGTLAGGMATFQTTTLPVATYNVTAVYMGVTAFQGSTSAPSQVVINQDPQTITLSSLPATVTYGASALTVTATASSGLPVTITVSGPATLSGSTLSITGAGVVTVTASQAGNATYAPATNAVANVTVNPAPLAVTPANATIPYGSAIPALTGSVTGLVNGDAITANYATTATSTSVPGSYPITATLSDPNSRAANYTVTLNTGTLTITQAITTTVLSTPATASYGSAVTLSATVSAASGPSATGMVTFMNGTAVLGTGTLAGGSASFQPSSLAVGNYSVTAVYAGNANEQTSSSQAAALSITQAPQTITLSTLPASATYGVAPLTVSATSNSGLPVTLSVNGPATLTGSTLAINGAGSVKITATQAGNTNYQAATVTATITVAQAPLVVAPANVTITYHSAIPALTGTVMTLVNGDSITAVYATTATATSAPGTYPITATLSDPNGRGVNYNVTLNTGTLTITAVPTTTALSALATSYAGAVFSLVANVSSATGAPASGTVTFMNGATVLSSVAVTNGVASYQIPSITAGTYSFTATYAASAGYGASTSTQLAVTIVPAVTATLSPAAVSLAAGANGTSTLSLTPGGGFTGAAQVTCASPVAYITCMTTSAVSLAGGATATDAITVSVAATARLTPPAIGPQGQQTMLAGLAVLGALAVLPLMRKRRGLRLLALLIVALGASFAMTGCGGGASSSPVSNLPPAGSQAVTVTVVAAGTTVTQTLTVNVTN